MPINCASPRLLALPILLGLGCISLLPGSALAETGNPTARDVQENAAAAIADQNGALASPLAPSPDDFTAAIDGGSVGIPRDSGDAVEAFGHGSSILVSLPADDTSATRIGGTVVYDGPTDASDLAVQATPDGIRALVSINDSSAVRSYEFPISGDVARIDRRSDGASRSSTRGAAGLAVSMRHGHRTQTGIRCLRISTL
jgi:hypothetical protein